eukprot:TRINITY_DN20317_c0_g1_i1.p2 TRINITY_DN20317_c0_g1~~TRINITY_DN20317_c0_g1_i1.p2  ORF type:complete len:184 (-),score=35.97 TRINITY_DN20317_c0_g1_i1:48-599(-)
MPLANLDMAVMAVMAISMVLHVMTLMILVSGIVMAVVVIVVRNIMATLVTKPLFTKGTAHTNLNTKAMDRINMLETCITPSHTTSMSMVPLMGDWTELALTISLTLALLPAHLGGEPLGVQGAMLSGSWQPNEYSRLFRLGQCHVSCLLYTSDAADEEDSVDLGGRRIIKKKKEERKYNNNRK